MADIDPLDTDSMPFLVSSSEVSPDDSMPSLEVLPESEESDDSVYTVLPYAQDWNPVVCVSCGGTAGIYKYYENPGNRDNPTWVMRCVDPSTNAMATQTPYKQTSVCHRMSEDEVKQWIRDCIACCRR